MTTSSRTQRAGVEHEKRFEDGAMLAAGIDVFSTVQRAALEEPHGPGRKLDGPHVRETIPDAVLRPRTGRD